jgi:two-component system OmpR family response regulator
MTMTTSDAGTTTKWTQFAQQAASGRGNGAQVLVVEDDRVVGNAVQRSLLVDGYAVHHAQTAEQAKVAVHFVAFDVAIVDIGLPDQDGLQLVSELRRTGFTLPVLMLTARDAPSDRATALALGANDYMTKPFRITELLARCQALVRHAESVANAEFVFGDLKLDRVHRHASRAGVPLNLSSCEWLVLECLVLNAGRIVSRDKLVSGVTQSGTDRTPIAVEDTVSRLRGKLGDTAVIHVIRGLGYRLDDRKA